jgi:cell division protein ZipA
MSALQWALLVLGVGIALLLIGSSRRERRASEQARAPKPQPAIRDWSAHADAPAPGAAAPRAEAAFDELGVGKPRRRVAPEVGEAPPAAAASPAAAPAPPAAGGPAAIVVGLYIAEHEGTNILGPKIHAALQERGLRFGARRIYHRMQGEVALFSVASLVKPGVLDPQDAEGFATPGLSVFMALPGPANPVAAFQDMLDTARGLARALNAELYDSEQRAPLTAERERALHLQVEEWARRHTPAGRLGA